MQLKNSLFLAAALVAACAPSATGGSGQAPTPAQSEPGSDWVESTLKGLSLREKAAQMVWPTLLGDYTSGDSPQWQHLTNYIKNEKVGGFTISVGSPTEVASKLNALQEMSSIPLVFGADLEAGAGFRARGGYFIPNAIDLGGAIVFPPEMAIGATGDTVLAYEQGKLTAIEGRALGIHIAYAPVLDVNNNPANPVINTRSYGEDPAAVARLGAAFIRGVQDNGMLATGKHFPGHGDTGINSHLALPVVTVSRNRLDSVELVPFRAAVNGGVEAMMSFHGAMPALDSSGVPGTLSQKVLTDLLRTELKFKGIIISDAMDMAGVLNQYGAIEAVKRAVAAGVDILIQPLDVAKTIDAVVAGVQEGRYSEARIDESVRRILKAKHDLGLDRRKLVNLDSLRYIVGDSSHAAMARRIAEKSITLVKDSLNQVPLRVSEASRVLSVTVGRRSDLSAGVAFNGELRSRIRNLRSEFLAAEDPSADYARLERAADSADVTIVSSYVGQNWDAVSASAPQAFASFVQRLTAKGKRLVVVSFGNPYLLDQIPATPAYVVAWGGFSPSQAAAARALLGAQPITGKLPISIPVGSKWVARGTGIQRAASTR
ncbi:MAG TPA: glycoside hydrolase family 3 N-terminal domain-containing protein [Gemmatimonadaceae bacterium]|nr:glycoside hydrolase family 3 N-terminal domain-containing protein [Gemmatimonadaceae bacterium]